MKNVKEKQMSPLPFKVRPDLQVLAVEIDGVLHILVQLQ